ncbi:MAG: hypothetical protein ACK551_00775 [Vampirovibrionales bacterium]
MRLSHPSRFPFAPAVRQMPRKPRIECLNVCLKETYFTVIAWKGKLLYNGI